MPTEKIKLPPEILSASGDFKSAARAFKDELAAIDREILKEVKKGRPVRDALLNRRSDMERGYEETQKRHKEIQDRVDKSVSKKLVDALNTHNPHRRVGRILRGNILASDIAAFGEAVQARGLKTFASSGGLRGAGMIRAGGLITKAAGFGPYALAAMAAVKAVGMVGDHFEAQKKANEAEGKTVGEYAELNRRERFKSTFPPEVLARLQRTRRVEAERVRRLAVSASITESFKSILGLDTPEARAEAAKRGKEVMEAFQLRTQFGEHTARDVMHRRRREIDFEIFNRAGAGGSNFITKAFHQMWFAGQNALKAGAPREHLKDQIAREFELKELRTIAKKRADALEDRRRDPAMRAIDLENNLRLRTVHEWDVEKTMQWNPY